MKLILKTLLTLLFALIISDSAFAKAEVWLKIYKPGSRTDDNYLSTTVTIYRKSTVGTGFVYFDHGTSYSVKKENDANAFGDMVGSTDTDNATWDPMSWETTYLIKIENYFCYLNIGANQSSGPDVTIIYQNGVFEEENFKGPIRMGEYGAWNPKTLTVKNNFSNGKLTIDETYYPSVSSAGVTDSYGEPTFPRYLLAHNNQTQPDGGVQKFNNWITPSGNSSNLSINGTFPSTSSATYESNFTKYFGITFQNSMVSIGNAGTLKIGGQIRNMPYPTVDVIAAETITAEAIGPVVNGIIYTFNRWSDGNTQNPRTFTASSVQTHTVEYIGIPDKSPMNTTLNYNETGQPVRLTWTEHPNTNVTQYKVWRGAKVDGNFSNPVVIATLNRGTTSYTDYEFVVGGSSPNSVAYDVVPYYSTENNWGTVGTQIISATKDLSKIAADNNEAKAEYSMDNYPNPFNPSTKINFTLPEAGFVKLTIYNALGQKIKELVNIQMNQGSYTSTWYGDNEFGKKVNSGIYFSVLESRNRRIVQKMILSK